MCLASFFPFSQETEYISIQVDLLVHLLLDEHLTRYTIFTAQTNKQNLLHIMCVYLYRCDYVYYEEWRIFIIFSTSYFEMKENEKHFPSSSEIHFSLRYTLHGKWHYINVQWGICKVWKYEGDADSFSENSLMIFFSSHVKEFSFLISTVILNHHMKENLCLGVINLLKSTCSCWEWERFLM